MPPRSRAFAALLSLLTIAAVVASPVRCHAEPAMSGDHETVVPAAGNAFVRSDEGTDVVGT